MVQEVGNRRGLMINNGPEDALRFAFMTRSVLQHSSETPFEIYRTFSVIIFKGRAPAWRHKK
jgi:hypothetical protein